MILRPLTTAGAQQIEHWFDDPEVAHWLGGRDWLRQQLDMVTPPGETFRGKVVLRSHAWLALDSTSTAVAFVGGDVYDRWVPFGSEPTGPEQIRTSMGLAFVVDPPQWGRGLGRRALDAVLDEEAVADVEAFYCGVDVDNAASRRCCLGAGYRLIDPQPDGEGMLYYRRERRP